MLELCIFMITICYFATKRCFPALKMSKVWLKAKTAFEEKAVKFCRKCFGQSTDGICKSTDVVSRLRVFISRLMVAWEFIQNPSQKRFSPLNLITTPSLTLENPLFPSPNWLHNPFQIQTSHTNPLNPQSFTLKSIHIHPNFIFSLYKPI